ncbi:MAG: YfiT family bacillithiol transferase [Gemmatimonadota bacterium]
MSHDPRYPVGRYQPPESNSDALRAGWLHDLESLPALLRAAVWGLDDEQFDTPYREGGWTVRQVVHHVADSHINAYCRFKLALTEEHPTIRPYEEALWAELPEARALPVESSLVLLDGLHARWAAMCIAMTPAQFDRSFHHPESHKDATLWRTLGMYAWHGKHHVAHITSLRSAHGW